MDDVAQACPEGFPVHDNVNDRNGHCGKAHPPVDVSPIGLGQSEQQCFLTRSATIRSDVQQDAGECGNRPDGDEGHTDTGAG